MTSKRFKTSPKDRARLSRSISLTGAVFLGLGSMIGTGVYVSLGIGASIAGAAVLAALSLAAVLAACNALSSAELAAAFPFSGGTYEYGYRVLTPGFGFAAGWMFLIAKSASAATAALGVSGYLLGLAGVTGYVPQVLTAAVFVLALTMVATTGIRRSSHVNTLIVIVTLVGLGLFIAMGVYLQPVPLKTSLAGAWNVPMSHLLEAAALMFVAYTGYGRIATLGEEVETPEKTIPKAVITTIFVVFTIYMAVATAALTLVTPERFGALTLETKAPLEAALNANDLTWAGAVLALTAATAMLGVLFNLLLGLSRVLFAMGRRGDLPGSMAKVDVNSAVPVPALATAGVIIVLITLAGSVQIAWSFSAITVLIYYAVTNLAALRLGADKRLYPAAISWIGLAGCLGLAMWVEAVYWLAAAGLLVAGFAMRAVAHRTSGKMP